MPDERQDPTGQGIGTPEKAPTGHEAEAERKKSASERPGLGLGTADASDTDASNDDPAFESEVHDSGRRADHRRGPGEGAD